MKLKKYIILCLITSLTGGLSAQKTMTGIEVLKKDNFLSLIHISEPTRRS